MRKLVLFFIFTYFSALCIAQTYKSVSYTHLDITQIEKNEIYKVPVGKIVNLNDNINIMQEAKIYIAGTLVISEKNSFQNHKEAKFIILSKEQ